MRVKRNDGGANGESGGERKAILAAELQPEHGVLPMMFQPTPENLLNPGIPARDVEMRELSVHAVSPKQ